MDENKINELIQSGKFVSANVNNGAMTLYGMEMAKYIMRDYGYDAVREDFNSIDWQGDLAIELARVYHNAPPRTIATVASSLQGYRSWLTAARFKFTRQFDWKPGDFGDGDSCFWQGRRAAKDMILQNDGFAILFYGPRSDNATLARCWAVWSDELDGLITFNYYKTRNIKSSSNGGAEMTTVLANYFDCGLNQVVLSNQGARGGLLYINNFGWLLTKKPKYSPVSHDLRWPEPKIYQCRNCNCTMERLEVEDSQGLTWCTACAKRYLDVCNYDMGLYQRRDLIQGPDGKLYFHLNIEFVFSYCQFGGSWHKKEDMVVVEKDGASYLIYKDNVEKFHSYAVQLREKNKTESNEIYTAYYSTTPLGESRIELAYSTWLGSMVRGDNE